MDEEAVIDGVETIAPRQTDEHNWPSVGHVFSGWHTATGLPKATQYRVCIHPACTHVEYRDVPNV